jgi:hypothetical protein
LYSQQLEYEASNRMLQQHCKSWEIHRWVDIKDNSIAPYVAKNNNPYPRAEFNDAEALEVITQKAADLK